MSGSISIPKRLQKVLIVACFVLLIPLGIYENLPEDLRYKKITLTAASTPNTKVMDEWQSYNYAGNVSDIAVAPDGIIWTTSKNGGVTAWDLSTNTYRQYGTEHGLADSTMVSIDVAPDGRVWAASNSSGISVFDGTTWESIRQIDGEPIGSMQSVSANSEGVWFSGSGIYHYDGQDWTVSRDDYAEKIVATDSGKVYCTTNRLSEWSGTEWLQIYSSRITDFDVTEDGAVWVLSGREVLVRNEQGLWSRFDASDIGFRRNVSPQNIEIDDSGNVWVAGYTTVVKYDGETWRKLRNISAGDTMYASAEALLWSKRNTPGLFYLADKRRMHLEVDDFPVILPSDYTRMVGIDQSGVIWSDFGQEQVVYRLARTTDAANTSDIWEEITLDKRTFAHVFAMDYASDGTLWFLSSTTVYQMRGDGVKVSSECYKTYDEKNTDIVIAEDDSVWVVCQKGLVHYVDTQWIKIDGPENYGSIIKIALENDSLYVTTDQGLIVSYDIASQEWKLISSELSQMDINDIVVIDNELWLATGRHGVYVLASEDDTWHVLYHYTQEDGLISDDVARLRISPNSPVRWFATYQGVSCYDGITWVSFTTEQGLVDDLVYDVTRSPDGSVWFATASGGISRFTPSVSDNDTCPHP